MHALAPFWCRVVAVATGEQSATAQTRSTVQMAIRTVSSLSSGARIEYRLLAYDCDDISGPCMAQRSHVCMRLPAIAGLHAGHFQIHADGIHTRLGAPFIRHARWRTADPDAADNRPGRRNRHTTG